MGQYVWLDNFEGNGESVRISIKTLITKTTKKEGGIVPTNSFTVKWKRNRNNKGEETVFSQKKAIKLAEEKKSLGFKVEIRKLPKNGNSNL